MKITRRQLKQIIKENISPETTINISGDIPNKNKATTMDVEIPSVEGEGRTKVDASFTDEEGNTRELSNTEEDREKLLGGLLTLLDTAKDETKELVLKAIARITGEPEADENLPKVASKAKLDRKLAAAAQHVQNPNTNLTA